MWLFPSKIKVTESACDPSRNATADIRHSGNRGQGKGSRGKGNGVEDCYPFVAHLTALTVPCPFPRYPVSYGWRSFFLPSSASL